MLCEVGDTAMESTSGLLQPAMGATKATKKSARGQKRSSIINLRSLQPAWGSDPHGHSSFTLALMPLTIGQELAESLFHKGVNGSSVSNPSIRASAPFWIAVRHVLAWADIKMGRTPEVDP
jgi:hypothetical protein